MICPAYQSAFIYDQDELRKKFSYFQEDSTPKIYTASKNKYLVAEPTSYRKKLRSLQTVAMKPVNVHVPDSLQPGFEEESIIPGAELDLAARSVIDSIYIEDVEQDTLVTGEDSVYVISKDKEIRLLKYNFPDSLVYDPATGKYASETPYYEVTEVTFNVEQDNYMWYLRDYLVLPDVRLSKMAGEEQSKAGKAGAAKKKQKKGIKGFFANLFKKKDKKAAPDSTTVKPPPSDEEEFDYIDETQPQTSATDVSDQPTEKKGAFSFLKKKKTSTDEAATLPEEEKPAKKKKEKKKKEEPATEEDAEEKEDGF
jgi:hypothetical protein